VFNTLGRVESVAGGDWLSKFRATLKLQTNDLAEAARTYCYLTRALARHGMLAEAEAALAEVEGLPHMPDFSGWELAFVRAEVARRRGQVWSVAVRDGVTGGPYNRAFYFQATARQAGRSAEDRRERYRRAEAFLRPAPGPGQNLLTMLAEAVRLRAAADAEDTGEWTAARAGLRACLDATGAEGLAAWYGEAWSALGAAPDAEAAEAFLARVPYF
jgi:hypothetical protein